MARIVVNTINLISLILILAAFIYEKNKKHSIEVWLTLIFVGLTLSLVALAIKEYMFWKVLGW